MKKTCEILVWKDDKPFVAGKLQFDGSEVTTTFIAKFYEVLMQDIAKEPLITDGGTRRVSPTGDPAAWFAALPSNYSGSYLQAKIV